MYEDNIYVVKSRKLVAELQVLNEELMKKQCYHQGLQKQICDLAEEYYEGFKGKWCKLDLDKHTNCGADVRIGRINVDFSGETVVVTVYVAVDPADLKNNIKWTDAEKKLLSNAKKIWNEGAKYRYFYNFNEMKAVAAKLMILKNEVEIVQEYRYFFDETELINGKNICKGNLIIGKQGDTEVLLSMFEERKLQRF